MANLWVHIYVGLILFVVLTALAKSQDNEKPFVAVWNAPTDFCMRKFGIKISVSQYGILENKGGAWRGEQMVIFYHRQLGNYPYLTENGEEVNGGVPQAGDLPAHLKQAALDIETFIPKKGFSGYAVIDWESWRPIYKRNFSMKRYWYKSRDIVRRVHPEWSEARIEEQAEKDFEKWARSFMEETLKLGKILRPKAKWGFYGFPQCYNWGGQTHTCSQKNKDFNNRLSWMYQASTALYPSGYIHMTSATKAWNFTYGQLSETIRVRAKFCHDKLPLLLYTRYTLADDKTFLNKDLLNVSLTLTAVTGFHGTVIWGSSVNSNTASKCQDVKNYLRDVYGPYTRNLMHQTQQCSQQKCSGNGRCFRNHLGNGYEQESKSNSIVDTIQSFSRLKDSMDKLEWNNNFCHCFKGWKGDDCSEIIESD